MQTTLIVTTYNRPGALELVLRSASSQKVTPHELLVVDDGSTDETRDLVERYARQTPFSVRHIWQQDLGFRLARARNMGIAASTGDYLVFVDGDMVLHPRFVQDHIRNAVPGVFAQGSRVLLGRHATDKMLAGELRSINFLTRGIERRRHTIRNRLLSRLTAGLVQGYTRGCNQGFWRQHLIRANGFNEDYVGWGSEDAELGVRLTNAGVGRRVLKFQALAYHLEHEQASREQFLANNKFLDRSRAERLMRCDNGLDKHLDEPLGDLTGVTPHRGAA